MPRTEPPSDGSGRSVVVAAGAVVYREGPEVLLVHRPRYDDWSFPKGKLDPGEHEVVAAVREVAEETGVHVRLGPTLAAQQYELAPDRSKRVHYWVARARADDDVSDYRPNAEIDAVEWVPWSAALRRLTYPRDQASLRESWRLRRRTSPLLVLRHAHALPRQGWTGDDRRRPLSSTGESQAAALVPLLAAYDVSRLVTSSSRRCVQSVEPYADECGLALEERAGLSEEDATAGSVVETVDALLGEDEPAVLCTHRTVLPAVFDVLGVPDPGLEKGQFLVAHHRRGRVVVTEIHSPR